MSRINPALSQSSQSHTENIGVAQSSQFSAKDVSVTYAFTPEEVGIGRNEKKPPTVRVSEEQIERALFRKLGFDVSDKAALAKVKDLLNTEGSPFNAVKTTGSLIARWNETTKKYEIPARIEKQLYDQLKGKVVEVKAQLEPTQSAQKAVIKGAPGDQVAVKNGVAAPNSNAVGANSSVGSNQAPQIIKVKLTLPNDGKKIEGDRALLGHVQQKYGGGNLFGQDILNIRDLSKLQGVTAQNLSVTRMGNQNLVEFQLSAADAAKIQRNYESVQAEVNRAEAIVNNARNNNEAASFLRGFGNGVWNALKSNWDMITDPIGTAKAVLQMVTNPLETLEGIKKLIGDKWTEFQNADPSKKAEMLGEIAGELAVDALLTKGAGKVAKLSKTAELLKGTKIGEQIISKADDAATAAKVKLAATFSDEAAQAASQRIRQRLATQLYSGIPADVLADMAIVAGNKLAKGTVKFADFAQQMINDFGEKVRPELERLYREGMEKLGLKDKIDEAGIQNSSTATAKTVSAEATKLLDEINKIRGSLKNADAVKAFEKKFNDIVRDSSNPDPERLKAFQKYLESAKARGGGSVEQGLAGDWNKINKAPTVKPPFGAAAGELPGLRAQAEKLMDDVTKWAAAHPEIKGVDRIVTRIKADVDKVLTKMEAGNLEATAERVQGFKNNLKGAEGEWIKAQNSPPGTEIGRNLRVNGRKYEIDGLSPDGKIITNTKRYNLFGINDPRLAELKAQALKTLKVAEANPVDGQIPKVVFDFPDGVTPEVAAELRKVSLNGRHLEVTGPEKPLPHK